MTSANHAALKVVHRDRGGLMVEVSGEIDSDSAPALRSCLNECLAEGCRELTVDMTGLTFIDSSGLNVLVRAINQLRPDGGRLILRNPPPMVRRILGITGLTPYLGIVTGDLLDARDDVPGEL